MIPSPFTRRMNSTARPTSRWWLSARASSYALDNKVNLFLRLAEVPQHVSHAETLFYFGSRSTEFEAH